MADLDGFERTVSLRGRPMKLAGPELKPGDAAPDFEVVDSKLQATQLANTGNRVRIFSVVPSLDTPVCDAQTRRFEDESAKLPAIGFYTDSMDLPFAQKRWCGAFGVERVGMLSDHRNGSFGEHYGTLISDMRMESRAVFVVDKDNRIRYAQYVPDLNDHPDYEAALEVARQLANE